MLWNHLCSTFRCTLEGFPSICIAPTPQSRQKKKKCPLNISFLRRHKAESSWLEDRHNSRGVNSVQCFLEHYCNFDFFVLVAYLFLCFPNHIFPHFFLGAIFLNHKHKFTDIVFWACQSLLLWDRYSGGSLNMYATILVTSQCLALHNSTQLCEKSPGSNSEAIT